MKAIGTLGQLDDVFGMAITTRSWGTLATVVRALDDGRTMRVR
jgi:hypothetical protein